MYLTIDSKTAEVRPDQTLLELVKQLDLDHRCLSQKPLAAKLAGEVFTLNYIPVRLKDADPDRPSVRRAMAASGGEVRLLRYGDSAGKECYIRTAQFVIFLALQPLWPDARAKRHCPLGSAAVFHWILPFGGMSGRGRQTRQGYCPGARLIILTSMSMGNSRITITVK